VGGRTTKDASWLAGAILATSLVGCCRTTGTLGSCKGGNEEQGIFRYRVEVDGCARETELFAQSGTVEQVEPGGSPVAIGVEAQANDSRLTVWARPPKRVVFERKVVDLDLERDNPIVVRCVANAVTIARR
jgi:hypothetical protein